MTSVVRPRLCDIGPVGKSLSPPAIVFRNGMILRQIKSNQADLVEAVDFTLPFFREFLLIADNATDLEILGNVIGGNAQMVNNDGVGIIHDTKTTLTQTECNVPILTVTWRESNIESPELPECLRIHK